MKVNNPVITADIVWDWVESNKKIDWVDHRELYNYSDEYWKILMSFGCGDKCGCAFSFIKTLPISQLIKLKKQLEEFRKKY